MEGPLLKYDHTASSGGLWPLPGQRSHQQDADKEMQNSDNGGLPIARVAPLDQLLPLSLGSSG